MMPMSLNKSNFISLYIKYDICFAAGDAQVALCDGLNLGATRMYFWVKMNAEDFCIQGKKTFTIGIFRGYDREIIYTDGCEVWWS